MYAGHRVNDYTVALAYGMFLLCASAASAADAELVELGRERYQNDCASCHGPKAHGDGAVAAVLTIRPTDLTVLSKGNRDQFPGDYVRRVIDGRELPAAAHGHVAMPVWGKHYKRTLPGYSEASVQRKIDALIAYLRSIQIE
ncbi:MAG TPA: c-type cytochrome [Gammaproteobacteria bacterium]|nr:c-type cytochrome [Gammaproteobacteria bacterium]